RPERVEAVDTRMLVIMRCVLAVAALAIIYIDPLEPSRLIGLTYASLIAYCLYSAAVVWRSYRAGWPTPARATYWTDVAFYVYLVGLTQGTSSIFFFFFFFSIIAAWFSRGYREGAIVTTVSVALFLVVGLIAAPSGAAFELDRTLIRPVYLLGLGYMLAYWGGYEIELKQRLRLLQEVSSVWNPRFGPEQTIGANLERLLDFFGADACVLVLRRPGMPPRERMYRATRRVGARAWAVDDLTEASANALLTLPETCGAVYQDRANWPQMEFRRHFVYDLEARRTSFAYRDVCTSLANLLETRAFVTVPYAQRDGTGGRLFVTASRPRFSQRDIEFLAQFASTLSIVVESMALTEALVSRAAENERLRVSRDLHDTTLQPYIGIKLAIDALQREAGAADPLAGKIARLSEMVGETIRDLRALASELGSHEPLPGEFLVSAVARQADRYKRFYGIEVEVKSEISPRLDGRVAAEAYQIIAEGLSNIVRHTEAKRAAVSITCEDARLRLEIANPAAAGQKGFAPRSISGRAQALGGAAIVEPNAGGYTVVRVSIPI
ncbi:MAG: histidine kinase, partial [Burkholderiales bacterium]|nr:histidine kinase [Burkholderiales bacterium]